MQARATQRSRHVQRRDLTLTPKSVQCLPTMTRLNAGGQAATSLSQLLHTIGLATSGDLMPSKLRD